MKPPLPIDNAFPNELKRRLDRDLPGRKAQRQFAHGLSHGRHFWIHEPKSIAAATVIVLMQSPAGWRLPLTLRPVTLASHGGQICLPGGRKDPGETLEEAAVREVEEELRLPRTSLTLLGSLSPLYLYVSNFLVTPFVATCSAETTAVDPNTDEVAKLIWMSIADLIDPEIRGCQKRNANAHLNVEFAAPFFALGEHRVWGATAMMLSEFAAIIEPKLTQLTRGKPPPIESA